ncbi:MAG: hypothetical protein OFPI_03320 [Osedax symbiont Rs2]|nr:MAG: hypothetical protein OFPI_03320 [Osedax symbiont Rs2]
MLIAIMAIAKVILQSQWQPEKFIEVLAIDIVGKSFEA